MCRLVLCASYHTIKEIENEMTTDATKRVKATPLVWAYMWVLLVLLLKTSSIGLWKPKVEKTCYSTNRNGGCRITNTKLSSSKDKLALVWWTFCRSTKQT